MPNRITDVPTLGSTLASATSSSSPGSLRQLRHSCTCHNQQTPDTTRPTRIEVSISKTEKNTQNHRKLCEHSIKPVQIYLYRDLMVAGPFSRRQEPRSHVNHVLEGARSSTLNKYNNRFQENERQKTIKKLDIKSVRQTERHRKTERMRKR